MTCMNDILRKAQTGEPGNKGQFGTKSNSDAEENLIAEDDTMQTSAPLAHISLNASNRSAREVARIAEDGYMDLNPPYQRGSVWTEHQRRNLVKSWLMGLPVPAIVLNDRWKDDVAGTWFGYSVVDGKQRIETAAAWFDGSLAVPSSWFRTEDVETTETTDDGPYVRYTGLSIVAQRHMSNRAMLPVIETQVKTVREEAELFDLLNTSGTAQDDGDIQRARDIAGR